MNQKTSLLLILVLLSGVFGFAQTASKCEEIPGFKKDFCAENPKFPGACAQFQDGSEIFYFKAVNGKKYKQITTPKGVSGEDLLIEIAKNKSLKLSATDILFIQSALSGWNTAQTEGIIKKITEIKRTEAELTQFANEKTASGLGFQLLRSGGGKTAEAGKKVTVHYRGYLKNGQVFDASFDRGTPFDFTLGKGQVIKGWDEGIAKLKVGDHAILRIPPDLGYGARKVGSIPENSELIFEVFLLGVN